MLTSPALLASVGLVAGLAASAPQAPSPAPQGPTAALARIDHDRCAADVRALVERGPRMGGTRSGDRAATWLAAEFLAAGLDVNVYADPLKWAHEELAFEVVAHGPTESFRLERAWPYGFSPSATGRVALSLEDSEGAWLRSRMPRFGRTASQAAVVLVDGATSRDGEWPKVGHLRAGDANPAPVFGISKPEGERLRAGLERGEAWELEFALEARIERGAPKTVEARIAAAPGAPPGYLLFSAHGDSDAGGPGANDNASGEAILLAIARAWQGAIDAGELPPPAREVRFAIWGSEIYSTNVYLDAALARGEELVGVINYDQAGFGSEAEQLNIEPDDLPANRAFIELLAAELAARNGADGFPARWATNKSLGGTDSYVFSGNAWFKAHEVPAVTLFTSAWDKPEEHPRTAGMPGESWSDRDVVYVDYDNYYHSAGDTPENTTDKEPWNMGWCARVGLAGGLAWLDALERSQADE